MPVVLIGGFADTYAAPPAAVPLTIGFGRLKMLGMSDEEWEHGVSPAPEPVVAEARPQAQ